MGRVARQRQRNNREPETGWEHVADWYAHSAGKDGFEHHQSTTIPALLDLLGPQSGERILDIGCGTGVLAPPIVKAGATYVGVDVSPTMLGYARRQHGHVGRFVLADARALHVTRELVDTSFDAAVFLLSIQDVDPLAAVFSSLTRVLATHARVVILMTHPCFRVPRQSGWVWDGTRQLQSRRIDRYLTPLVVPVEVVGKPSPAATARFHRPLAEYVASLSRVGLAIDRLVEIPSQKGARAGPRADAERTALGEIPMFLGLRARR